MTVFAAVRTGLTAGKQTGLPQRWMEVWLMDNGNQEIYLMEAANGMMVCVPADRLEDWLKGQEEVRAGRFKASGHGADEIVSQIYGSNR